MKKIVVLSILLFYCIKCSYAQHSESLDPTFGKDGIVSVDMGAPFDYPSLARQVLVREGSLYVILDKGLISKRFPNGSTDSSYGFDGYSRSVPLNNMVGAFQPDGKIVLAGSYGDTSFGLVRLGLNGLPDSSFGTNGIQISKVNPRAIIVQPDGKIVVAGYTTDIDYKNYFTLARYTTGASPDSSFNGNGQQVINFGFKSPPDYEGGDSLEIHDDYANALLLQADGKIIAAGYAYTGVDNDFALARLKADGSPDNSFGNMGRQTTNIGSGDDFGYSLALQDDNKIVLAGYSSSGSDYRFALVRYTTSGNLDHTFSDDGKQVLNAASDMQTGNAVAIQSNGKIVVAGYTLNDSDPDNVNNDFLVARFNTNGNLDNSFGTNGKLITDFNTSDDYAGAIALQADDKIIVAGYSYTYLEGNTREHFALTRYEVNGSADSSFSDDGKLVGNYRQGNTAFNASVIQPDGKIVAAGLTWNGIDNDFALARFNTDGSPDSSFSGDGKKIIDFGAQDDRANAVLLQTDGKIIVAGTSNAQFCAARFNTDGSPDNTFNADGKQIISLGFYADALGGAALQSDGKIVLGGSTYITSPLVYDSVVFSLVRLNSDGTLDNTFSGDGKLLTHFDSSLDFGAAVAIQPDGKIVLGGRTVLDRRNHFSLIRCNADGSLDNTFSEDGKQTNLFGEGAFNGTSLAIQPDGKILLAGFNEKMGGLGSSFVVARYNPNGELDNTFNDTGFQSQKLGPNFNFGRTVALSTEGKIGVGGNSNDNYALVLYKPDGRPDSTFSQDGIEITSLGTGASAIQSLAFNGNKLYAAGTGEFPGMFGVLARYLLPESKAPVVKITAPENNSIYAAPAAITINIDVSGSAGIISYVQIYQNNVLVYTDSTYPYTYTLNNAAPGNYSFVAKATAANGFISSSASVSVSVYVPANKAPVVNISAPVNNATYTPLSDIIIHATASDSDGVIASVRFYNGATLLKTDTAGPYNYTLNNAVAGTYRFYAVAFDNKGLTGSSATSYVVVTSGQANKAPDVVISGPENNETYTAPATVTLKATANDEDGDITRVQFYNGETLLMTDTTSPYAYTLDSLPAGSYSFIAKATDDNGLTSSSASLAISVIAAPNNAPEVNITRPADNVTYYEPATVSLKAEATDADGSISNVKFISGTTTLKKDSLSPYSFTTHDVAAGNYTYIAKATDDKGLASTSAGVHVTVLKNIAPVITLHANDSAYLAPALIILSAAASDSDGTISYVDFYNGAKLQYRDSTSPYNFLWTNVVAGNYSLTAKARDNHGKTTTSPVVEVTVKADTTLEAEDALLHGALIANDKPGFTGTGFADYVNSSGDYIEWTFTAPAAGPFTLKFRYANGATNRPLQLKVNGAVLNGSLNFNTTGSWLVWNFSTTTATLLAGTNKIRLTTIGSNGPNVDNLAVTANFGTLEAEDAVLSGAIIASNQPGYTGSGFADYKNASGDYIEWTVDAPDSGYYLLEFRYANATANRPLQFTVNGVVTNESLNFPSTGTWAAWSMVPASVSLSAGINKIRLTGNGAQGPNVDNLAFTSVIPVQSSQSFAIEKNIFTKSTGISTATISPNPARGMATLKLTNASGEAVDLRIEDIMGRSFKAIKFAPQGSNIFNFSVKDIPAGAYIVKLRQGSLRKEVRLIVGK